MERKKRERELIVTTSMTSGGRFARQADLTQQREEQQKREAEEEEESAKRLVLEAALKEKDDQAVAESVAVLEAVAPPSSDDENNAAVEDEQPSKKAREELADVRVRCGFTLTSFSQDTTLTEESVVYRYFRSLLNAWEDDLAGRDRGSAVSSKGRSDTSTYLQCKEYIRPLFKLCKRKQVPRDILAKLVQIVRHCEEGDFRSAHDHYIRAAIGNSAWPIGLTMVGIHERSGREKIQTDKVAHVMNNELQRKYFTSVKRLMTYAQSKRTDVAPSMKVL